ncbi:SRPBCC domain-containing protein [Lacinutrix sp. C3R15]|uniref:SRPBCC domain-containing protein n=1 Tax=Flavobacteriaceae TaxID=49546 RepID=UPI001C09B5FA|nr:MULTISPECIES: SRPBCC domain-containing protein [Flavobacteriaceae]MBU2938300.1 SRPBCC domain-containing protein [Lacinutrix sp. C3R15]MDO6621614.1 SRPBCC domain-containing protein [Oceanihabitans sp. 1_MG-2023]
MILESKAILQIQKPIEEVFEGIVNPEKITKYFIAESSGRLQTGKDVTWKFPEFDTKFPITEVKTENPSFISFVWDPETIVKITLQKLPDNSTIVRVNEKGKQFNEDNLKWALENSGGWANFLACMKAYLEYDIQLRKGAFDFMRKK